MQATSVGGAEGTPDAMCGVDGRDTKLRPTFREILEILNGAPFTALPPASQRGD
jgi:hypothetical protein